ncbi:MAG: single-stranded-DNA-specific exonuclease RecJ [Candidatus Dormiibacterota bacterium]
MQPAPRRWRVSDAEPLSGMHPVVGQVLAARGLDAAAAAAFLAQTGGYHDPFALPAMDLAVATVQSAIREHVTIAIYGDYDADGVTACAMLTRCLRAAGATVIPYIPNRMTEGYGLHAAALEDLAAQGAGCVITVDCGTSSVDVARGRPAGMRLVVTDHHLALAPGGTPPQLAPADALVNPKLPGSTYPFDGLAGAGVAFKLVQALESVGAVPPGSADASLGLAALGTIADMMPLRGENRVIVRDGLPRITDLPGLRALCEAAGTAMPPHATDIAFAVGPRINAAGRMEDARLALELCLSDDTEESERLAADLDMQNRLRQQAVATALAQAEERVAAIDDDAPAIVLGDPDWPMGIVGLVAGRIAERYARPTFIACLDPVEAKGSARSAGDVHIVRALDGAAAVLLRYGGHAAAAGFSLEASRFDKFRELINAAVGEQNAGIERRRDFLIDCEITGIDVTPELCHALDQLEPCGQGNPAPLLSVRGARVLGTSTFGSEGQHIRVALATGDGIVEAIAFNKPGLADHLPRNRLVDACFGLDLDTFQGFVRVRARLRDLRPAQEVVLSGSSAATVAGVAPG